MIATVADLITKLQEFDGTLPVKVKSGTNLKPVESVVKDTGLLPLVYITFTP